MLRPSDAERFDALIREIQQEFPRFRIVADPALVNEGRLAAFGFTLRMSPALIGTRHGIVLLRHDRVHLRDRRRLLYVFFWLAYWLLLPTMLTLRTLFEYRAYAETMRALRDEFGAVTDQHVEDIAAKFTGREYLWMLPCRPLVRWMLRRHAVTPAA